MPGPAQRLVERPARRGRRSSPRPRSAPIRTVDSSAIGSPSACRSRRRWTTGWRTGMPRLAASAVGRRADDPGQHARARDASGPGHLLGERHQPVGPAVGRRLGHEAAASRLARDQAVLGEPLHGVARGHPADPELGAQLGVRRQPLAGAAGSRSARAAPARSGGTAAGRPARSCGVAPLLVVVATGRPPSRRPPPRRRGWPRRSRRPRSRARPSRSRPRSSDVVRTRRRSSARIGSRSRSPAAATPPPITTRSGEMTVIMFAIPIPR